MEKWIIIAILVVAFVIYLIIKKKIQKKKRTLERKEKVRQERETARIIDIYNRRLSVTKANIPEYDVEAVAKFEYDWSEDSPFFYDLLNRMTGSRTESLIEFLTNSIATPIGIIKTLLESRKEVLKSTRHGFAHDEVKAYSKKLLRTFIVSIKNGYTIDQNVNFWVTLFSQACTYENIIDLDLYTEIILEDLQGINDADILLKKITTITSLITSKYLFNKLTDSEQYKNAVLEKEKRHKAKLQTELETFKAKGIIDEEFISYIKNHPDEKERQLIRKTFDEVAFDEVMNKFFPGQDYDQIKPEFLIALAQAYSGFTLKLLE